MRASFHFESGFRRPFETGDHTQEDETRLARDLARFVGHHDVASGVDIFPGQAVMAVTMDAVGSFARLLVVLGALSGVISPRHINVRNRKSFEQRWRNFRAARCGFS